MNGGAQQSIRPNKHLTGHIRWFIRTVKLSQSELEAKERQNENCNMSNCHSDAAKCNRISKLKHFSDSKVIQFLTVHITSSWRTYDWHLPLPASTYVENMRLQVHGSVHHYDNLNKNANRMHFVSKILKILFTSFRSTCFGHHRVHHQELLSCTCSLWSRVVLGSLCYPVSETCRAE